MSHVLVTGGAGFIGSHFVKRLLAADDITAVTVLDALTYAGHTENLGTAFLSPKLTFVHGNILDATLVDNLVRRSTAIVHFAAESHVDRSFYAAGAFVATNVRGTQTLLDAALRHGVKRFVHVSTDEVYGPMPEGTATEDSPLRPSVPYAASKAAADLIALSYHQTYGLPVCVTRASNNYGPCQHPEKVVPLFITRLLQGEPVTLHGHGEHVRNWLHVEDHCAGIDLVLRDGAPGEVYNIGGGTDRTTNELTGSLLRACHATWDAVTYIPDRQTNDIRYSMAWHKIAGTLGYRPVKDFEEGLAETVRWYRRSPDRWAPLTPRPKAAPAMPTALAAQAGR
ncbi:dTDP-glucose 4,6-dehydratase [Streptomyces sp. NBC_01525]|uniref:dTDP-glucose 4,6-dehydratase n=1 Tax=Streptomyces sp. NBC_01525 TaxID=2903893 RepID=UPI00386D97EA